MADKIVVLRDGRIEQVGAPLELYRNPDNKFVAGFIGSPSMNFLDCDVSNGMLSHPALSEPLAAPAPIPAGMSKVTLGIRPEHIGLDRDGDALSVDLTEALGGVSYSYLTAANGDKLVVEERDDERSREGSRVSLELRPERAMVFDVNSGERLR